MAPEKKLDPRCVFITPELPRNGDEMLFDPGTVLRVTRLQPLAAGGARFRLDVQGATGVDRLHLRVLQPGSRDSGAVTKTSRQRSRKDEEC